MPPRVLIVDDEESVTVTMAAILEMDGYSVATALRVLLFPEECNWGEGGRDGRGGSNAEDQS